MTQLRFDQYTNLKQQVKWAQHSRKFGIFCYSYFSSFIQLYSIPLNMYIDFTLRLKVISINSSLRKLPRFALSTSKSLFHLMIRIFWMGRIWTIHYKWSSHPTSLSGRYSMSSILPARSSDFRSRIAKGIYKCKLVQPPPGNPYPFIHPDKMLFTP